MIFIRILLILFFLSHNTHSSEKVVIRYIDFDFVFNNSSIGKELNKNSTNEKKKLIENSKKKETQLKSKKDDILSKKNILDPKEFEELVIQHQKNVEKYKQDTNQAINKVNKKYVEKGKDLKKKNDTILVKFVSENKIDVVLKKNATVVSNSKLDITEKILTLINNN